MTATTAAPPRIVTLDIVRGIAVMGILAMNIVAFSMPFSAYMNPAAYGINDTADFVAWVASFIFVDGKMRGLFSFLFGASMLLVIERARAKDESPASVHFRRMLWLLLFGLFHLYFIWFGDILALYAMVGMIAWLFRNNSPRRLVRWGIVFVLLQLVIFAGLSIAAYALQLEATAPGASAATRQEWQELERMFGVVTGQPLIEKLALFRGSYQGIVEYRLDAHGFSPIVNLVVFGWETLGYFLFGMAALKTGFITGDWGTSRYRRVALVGLGMGIPTYALLAWFLTNQGFTVPLVLGVVMAATVPIRPLMILGYAALIILATRSSGWLVERIAAAGRVAFTNYLGTSILMTGLFYGYGVGLYGHLGRAELWLVVVAIWALMLLWSKPWLERFNYGPFEWLWRSLARGSVQPMRKRIAAQGTAAA